MKNNFEMGTIIGIALLYTIITSIFLLIRLFNQPILHIFLYDSGFPDLEYFAETSLKPHGLWAIVTSVIIIILIRQSKKLNLSFRTDILQNRTIRITVGILIALEALTYLSRRIPLILYWIKMKNMIFSPIADSVNIVIYLSQIFLGIYLIKVNKNKSNSNSQNSTLAEYVNDNDISV